MQRSREYQALLYACRQEGCSICRIGFESTHRYLDAWKYELFTDVEVRQELRRTQGFCHTHTWQLARMGATLPLAQAYRDIITDAAEQLQSSGEISPPASGSLFRRLFESKENTSEQEPCPACLQRTKAEEYALDTLRKALLEEEFYQQFSASDGLCLKHFRQASSGKTGDTTGTWQQRLRSAQLGCLQRLDGQLMELIRKHDYRFTAEERGSEMRSWLRAAGLVAGEEFQP